MPQRTSGGVFDQQVLTGSLSHWVVCGADFSGAFDAYGRPVPNSAAEIIFRNIEESAAVNIMNPNSENLSFALEEGRSSWDEVSLTTMIQGLGNDVGVDHIDCTLCIARRVPYVWGCGAPSGPISFLDLTDTPSTYAGSAGYILVVNITEDGIHFSPSVNPMVPPDAFSVIDVPTQPSIESVGLDTLTINPGANISIITNPGTRELTISAASGNDYISIPPSTTLSAGSKYFVNAAGTVFLPVGTGSGFVPGTSVTVTKKAGQVIFVNTSSVSDIIATDLGNTDSIEFDATQECVFVFDGTSTWNLQIGSR